MSSPTTLIDPIRLALPSKGHLYEGIVRLLKSAGYSVQRASDRQYEATVAGQARNSLRLNSPQRAISACGQQGVICAYSQSQYRSSCPR